MLMIPHFSVFASPRSKKVLNNLLRPFKEIHPGRYNQPQGTGDQLHPDFLCIERLPIQVDYVLFLKIDLDRVALQVIDILAHLGGFPSGVFSDERGEEGKTDLLDNEDIQYTVIGAGGQRRMEAAAVKLPVAGAGEGLGPPDRFSAAADGHGAGDALKDIGDGGDHIADRAVDEGELRILVDAGADARVDADGADVDSLAPVAVDQVDGVHVPVQNRIQIAEQLLFRPEGPAEIVAGTGGKGTDGHVGQ